VDEEELAELLDVAVAALDVPLPPDAAPADVVDDVETVVPDVDVAEADVAVEVADEVPLVLVADAVALNDAVLEALVALDDDEALAAPDDDEELELLDAALELELLDAALELELLDAALELELLDAALTLLDAPTVAELVEAAALDVPDRSTQKVSTHALSASQSASWVQLDALLAPPEHALRLHNTAPSKTLP
jgi:hypothetical protein